MANHGPAYGDSAEVLMKRAALYDHALEKVIQQWIESVNGEAFPSSFSESLKDGVVLCKLLGNLKPGSVKPPKSSRMPFVQMENINNFLVGMKNCGFNEVDLFVTVDLYEAKNMLQVQHCLDKLRLRFGGEKITVARGGSDVFDSPSVQGGSAPARAPSGGVTAAPVSSSPAPAPATGAPKFCPECGAANSGGKFCAECGYKF